MAMNTFVRVCFFLSWLFVAFLVNLSPALAIAQGDARFLLTRTGFTPSDQEVANLAVQPSRASAVAALLARLDFTAKNPVNWMDVSQFPTDQVFENYVTQLAAPLSSNPATALVQLRTVQGAQYTLFRSWWTEQMRVSQSPMAERLVLFLHNYFVTSTEDPYLLWHLQSAFRVCGTTSGLSFACLLNGVVYDPGILTFLSQSNSIAGRPVANLARELMELFTVGVGNYSEQDVSEVARALTGLNIGPDGMAVMNAQFHDNSDKTIMGQTGNWGPDDVQRILLAQPALATRIVAKLWLEFVSPTPDPAMVATIATDLERDPQLRLVPIIGELLSISAFWSPANHGTLIKSPAEYVIGAMRQLGFDFKNEADVSSAIDTTGQRLWIPPNVRGFLTGTNWIGTFSMSQRQAIAHSLASMWQTQALLPQYGGNIPKVTPAQYVTWANSVMADVPMLMPPTTSLTLPQAAEMLLRDPAYWLK